MFGAYAFDQRHGLTEYRHVTFHNAVHILRYRQFAFLTFRTILQIRTYGRRLFDSGVDYQSFVCFVILGMFHDYLALMLISTLGLIGSLVIMSRRK